MKKHAVILTCLLCIVMLAINMVAANAVSINEMEDYSNSDYETKNHYAFIYSDTDEFAWARELIGDCSNCVPGYLYVQDLLTGEIWQVINQPVDMYRSSGETLYCVIGGTTIIQTNYWGQAPTELYTSVYGVINNIEFFEGKLYFSDGDHVIRYDLGSSLSAELAICEGISLLVPVSDTSFAWGSSETDISLYDVSTGHQENVDLKDLLSEGAVSNTSNVAPPIETLNLGALQQVTFPLPEYPHGSHFTNSGYACTHHDPENPCPYDGSCGCKSYRGSIQCAGFAAYAFDRYSHQYPISGGWYSDNNPHSDMTKVYLNTDDDVFLWLGTLRKGTHLRLSRNKTYDDGPVHSVIVADYTSTSITIYEGNADGRCMVMLNTYTLAEFRELYDYVHKTVSHKYDGKALSVSSSHHTVACSHSGCEGYIFENHYTQSPGSNRTCAACGYVGDIYVGINARRIGASS